MTGRKPPQRPYSDKEVGKLIQRATEIQEKSQHSLKQYLTIDEIEEIAAEIGIEPGSLRAAALELDHAGDSADSFSLTGAPFMVQVDRFVEGHVAEEQWEQVVLDIRRATGNIGEVSRFGNTREWVHQTKDLGQPIAHTQISLSSAGDQTVVSVQKQFRGAARMSYALAFMAAAGFSGVLMDGTGISGIMNVLIAGGSGLAGLAAARASLEVWANMQRAKAMTLVDRLQSLISGPAVESASAHSGDIDTADTENLSERIEVDHGESSGNEPAHQNSRLRS